MSPPNDKLLGVQAARGVAALLVVAHHVSLRFEQRVAEHSPLAAWDHFGFAGVDLFFVISGLIMMVTSHQHWGHREAIAPFLWRRATRIYPLYWFFTLVQLIAILLLPTATDRVLSAGHTIASFLLLPQSVYPILAPGWTLVFELYFYLIFSFLFLIPKRYAFLWLATWGLATVWLYSHQTTDGMTDTTDLIQIPLYATPMTLEFLAGCLIGHLSIRQYRRYAKSALMIGTLLFLTGWIFVSTFTAASPEFGMTRVLVFGIPSAMILYGLVAVPPTSRVVGSRTLQRIGDASYSLYLSHLLIINLFAMIWARLSMRGLAIQLAYEAVLIATCIAVALLVYRYLERPLLIRSRSTVPRRPKSVSQSLNRMA